MSQNIGSKGQSFLGYVGLAEETSYGGGGSPSAFADVISDGFSLDNDIQIPNTVRGRARYQAIAGAIDDSGSVDMAAAPENGIGMLLKAALGSSSVTASDPDGDSTNEVGTHTFSPADTLPSMAVEVGLGSVDAARHVGVGVDTLEFTHTPEEYLTASFDLPAKEPQMQGTQSSPSYSDLRPFIFHDATITLDATDRTVDAAELSMSLANNLEGKVRGERGPSKMHVGTREVNGNLDLDFENTNVLEKTLGSVGATQPEDQLYEASLNAKWVSPETISDTTTSYSLEIDIPSIRFSTHEANLNEDDAMVESVEWEAFWDATAGYDMQITLVNGQTTAY